MDFPPKGREQPATEPEQGRTPLPDRSPGAGLSPLADPYNHPGTQRPVLVAAPTAPSRAELWTHRIFLLVSVVFCIWIGMLLVVLPWTDAWTQNSFLARFPAVRALLAQNFVRGLASGLGLIDIWTGIWEAVHYREG